jgi:hypothetical protein
VNTSEGLGRVATVVRWLASLIAVYYVTQGLYLNAIGSLKSYTAFTVAVLLVVGGWVLAWVIDGFAKPKDQQIREPNEPSA